MGVGSGDKNEGGIDRIDGEGGQGRVDQNGPLSPGSRKVKREGSSRMSRNDSPG